MPTRSKWFSLSMVIVLLLQIGCSSLGLRSGPPAPKVDVRYGIKTLHLSWPTVEGAAYYRLLEDPDGVSGFRPVGKPFTSTEIARELALHRQANARYRVEACDSEGCTGSKSIIVGERLLEAVGYFKAGYPDGYSGFGGEVALSADGTTLVIAASDEDNGGQGVNGYSDSKEERESGAVYVFTRTDTGWSQQAYLKASNTESWEKFGAGIALSADGNTLAVGTPREDSAATGINGDQSDNSAMDAGAVYLFVRSGGQWYQQAYIKASNTHKSAAFGSAVALSETGNTLAVGAPKGNHHAGAVYLFTRTGVRWSQEADIKAVAPHFGKHFGGTLALSADGNLLAVGATGEASAASGVDGDSTDSSEANSGAVYLFSREGDSWSQQAYIKASNPDENDYFGGAVSLAADGRTLAVGASQEFSAAAGIDGKQSDNSAPGSGAVYIFVRDSDEWSQQAYIKASNPERETWFGTCTALTADGDTLAVGSYWENGGAVGVNGAKPAKSANRSGAVYLFTRFNGKWSQQAYIKATNTELDDAFGRSVAFSSDGEVLAVGATHEDGGTAVIGGEQSDNSKSAAGAVYLY